MTWSASTSASTESTSTEPIKPVTSKIPTPGGHAAPVVGLHVDLQGRAAYLGAQPVPLTAREYLLIELLYTSRGRLFSRNDILERLWGLDFPGDDRIVDTYVKRLRSKLGQGAVQTVRGLGYRCPLGEESGVAQPHLEKLPPEARLLTRLAGRILQVTDPGHIIQSVYELLREHCGVSSVSLWSLPGRIRLAQAGTAPAPSGPGSEPDLREGPDQAVVALGTGVVGEAPWAMLAFVTQQVAATQQASATRLDWSAEVRPALDAVAGLVNPALRLNGEILRRQHAEAQIRSLNHDLEARVQARTHDLARANADLRSLYNLAQQLSGAASLGEVWSRGLSGLARLAAAPICALWRLDGAAPDAASHNAASHNTGFHNATPHNAASHNTAVPGNTGAHCLAAFSPEGLDQVAQARSRGPLLQSALQHSLTQLPGAGHDQRRLSRRAELPGGVQALIIPVVPNLSQVYALHLELGAQQPTPDLGLLDAGARAFGLALGRQMQTLTLEQVALSDELTGLPNRRALLADLTGELAYSLRHGSALSLNLFELTGLRALNARLGFAAGNDLIRALSSELLGTLRTEDRVYRLGGALLASLVRSAQSQQRAPAVAALQIRLDELAARFGRLPSPAWPHGGADLVHSHVQAPTEASDLSAVLHLALERLDTASLELRRGGEAS